MPRTRSRRTSPALSLEALEDRSLPSGLNLLALGVVSGAPPVVRVFDAAGAAGGTARMTLFPFVPSFTGGVRVAVGDTDGDGAQDVIAAAGPGGSPHVMVFSGKDGSVLRSFHAFDPLFRGGVFVAAGDVNRDGRADIIAAAGRGGGPHVRVFSGADGSLLR